MSRLGYAIVFTNSFDAMRAFYEERIGLAIRHAEPRWVEFETSGAILALQEVPDEDKRGITLRFESGGDLDAEIRALEARGVPVDGEVIRFSKGRLAEIRDPEGNLLQMFQPRTGAPAGAKGSGPGRTVLQDGPGASNAGPALDQVILNVRDFARTVAFYRERMGLHLAADGLHWVEFDTGDTRLAVHHRPAGGDHPRHAEQPAALIFGTEDLDGWCDAMRARGLTLATAPVVEDFGTYAEAMDPDGSIVAFREPPPPESLEEQLAEEFEDDAPHVAAMRKPVKKGAAALSVLVVKPRHELETPPRRRRPSGTTQAVASVRGAGPEHSRLKPKRTADEKKARVKPAIGRLQKAKQRTLASQKRAAASASKSRPVKRAAAKSSRRRGR